MFASILDTLSNVVVVRELVLAAVVVLASAILARFLRQRQHGEPPALQRESARRLAFPLVGIVLLTLTRFIAHRCGWPGDVIGIVIELMVALAGVRFVLFALRYTFAPSGALANFERTLATLIWLGVALNLLGILPEFIDWLDSFTLHIGKTHITIWQVMQGFVTVVGTVIVALWLGGIVEARLLAASRLDSSLRVVFSRIIKAILLFIAVLMGMSFAGLDITTLSVFGGALGVGLGLGMQRIASNYVAGFIILLDRSIRIGSLIQVSPEQRGEVTQITTRYTVLRGLNGNHYIVPNELLISTVVQNETYSMPRLRVPVQVRVATDADVELALQILEDCARHQPRVLPEPSPRAYLAEFDDVGIKLELAFWIADPLKGTLDVRSNIQREMLTRFRAEGIALPQMQRTAKPPGPARPD